MNPPCKGLCIRIYKTISIMGGNPVALAKYPKKCTNCTRRFNHPDLRCPCCGIKFSLRIRGPKNHEGKARI